MARQPGRKRSTEHSSLTPDEIREIRSGLGFAQAELGEVLGVHWVTVSNWERGATAPDAYRAELLRRFEVASKLAARKGKEPLGRTGLERSPLHREQLVSSLERHSAQSIERPPWSVVLREQGAVRTLYQLLSVGFERATDRD